MYKSIIKRVLLPCLLAWAGNGMFSSPAMAGVSPPAEHKTSYSGVAFSGSQAPILYAREGLIFSSEANKELMNLGSGSIYASLTSPLARTAITITVQVTLVNTIDMSLFMPPSTDPTGVAYLSSSGTLLVSDSEVEDWPNFQGDNLFEVSLSGELLDTFSTIPFPLPYPSYEPTGVAYNPDNEHLFISDDDWKRVFEVNPGVDEQYDTSDDIVTSFSTSESDFQCQDPEGVAFDHWRGHLFIACGIDGNGELDKEVYDIDPGANKIFDGVYPVGDDQVSHFDTKSLGIDDPEGIEFDPVYGSLYILSSKDKVIAETTVSGTLIRIIDISSLPVIAASGLALAPGSTDPTQWHLYITDRGVDFSADPDQNDGKVYEVEFPPRSLNKIYLPMVTKTP